jgi:aspartate kinase
MTRDPIIVQKFGGTSVADTGRIMGITSKIAQELHNGNKVAVVISAMAGTTNTLLDYCRKVSPLSSDEELGCLDFVLSSGENISSGLVALALQNNGLRAVPLQGWQIPIFTNSQSSKALITYINEEMILRYLAMGFVPVICGFQGVNSANQITTLGRGGSDITAVALAAAIKAKRCDIYTDVTGVYSADPRFISTAKQIDSIEYDQMLELSYSGAKVMHPRSIEIAKEFQLDLRVISSFDDAQGTKIKTNSTMELSKIVGIAHNQNILLAKIYGCRSLSFLLMHLNKLDINISSAFFQDDSIFLLANLEEQNRLEMALKVSLNDQNIFTNFQICSDVAIVNIIGTKLLNNQEIIDEVLRVVQNFSIQYLQIDHSKISILLNEAEIHELSKILHKKLIETNHLITT